MKKLRLVIAESDSAYLEAISSYLLTSEHVSKFECKFFSGKRRMEQFIQEHHRFDILLTSSDMIPDNFTESSKSTLILLDDDTVSNRESTLPSVFKYQPLDQLISAVITIFYDIHGKKDRIGDSSQCAKIISVYSASGGSGKTTLAVNLSKQLSKQSQRVFYLNFEWLHSTPIFFPSFESHQASQALYYLKSNPNQLISKIESLKQYDPNAKVSYFDFPLKPEEMADLNSSEADALITALVETGNYDFIVIDLDSSLEARITTSIEKSDEMIWVLTNDLQSFHKTRHLHDSLVEQHPSVEGLDITFVLNKFTGHSPEDLIRYGIPVDYHLPYIPEWKYFHQGNEITLSSSYLEALNPLIDALRGVAVD
jgi:cellulose biosynthesis protein BcsQ